jgi:hypothetical protein
MSETGERVSRRYTGFRGADFRGEEINLRRSPDCLNVWKDYAYTESIRTRPGLALHTAFNAPVYGIFFFNGQMLVHSGSTLYKAQNGAKTTLYTGLREARSDSFIYGSKWYFKDGKHYLEYDGNTIKPVEGYVPTTSIARKPGGGGTLYEDVNMLTSRRKNTFLADGESTKYYLDAINIDSNFRPICTVNGIKDDNFTIDYAKGIVTFEAFPAAPLTDGRDNVEIEFSKTVQNHADNVKKCTLLQVFDNRVFISGNPEKPNTVWHCSLNDPTYFSDLDYYNEGLDNAAVKGLVAGNNALWVFREPSQTNTTVFYHTPTIDSEYGKIYPSQHSSVTTGCTGKAINFNDDIVFFSERGMEGISGDITTEQAVAHRSSLVDRKMIAATGYNNMILEEWKGYLFVIIGKKVFLADSRAMLTNENHAEYEWFYWELDKEITSARTQNGELYLGSADGVYTLSDLTKNIESYWVTPIDKFGAPSKLKTTNKRGCIVESTGDISVYAKLEDTDFELIGEYKNITDYFASRIKRKKFKDIQLKFHSATRFSLEAATLECFIGGYIKR